LLIFDNPIVDAATSHSSFDINEVRRQRMTIYIGIQPNRLEDAALLVNLFFSQLIDLNTSVLPEHDASLKYQCTLVLDEFTAIGRVNIIDTSNAFIAGYDLRLLTIIQAVSQMERPSLYGKEGTRTLVVNHGAKVVYPPKDHQEAKDLSDALGYFTETSVSKSRTPGKPRGENHSDQKRALMMPQELEEMGQDEEILLGFGKPIRCKKAFYYNDPVFVDRLKEMSPSLGALGDELPTEAQLKQAAGANELCTRDVPVIDPIEWQAKRRAATAARRPDGTRVARATDLVAMRDAEVSVALAAALAEGVYADLLELTGKRFNFADTGSQASAAHSSRSPIQEETTHG
jgi:type IV secretion system protein VirD4